MTAWESRMSPEEAVEIILLDEALDVCSNCRGVGYISNEPDVPESLTWAGLLAKKCSVCNGNVASFKPEYVEACVVLGKEVPRLTAYVTVERLRKNPNYKEPPAGPQKLVDIPPDPRFQPRKLTFNQASQRFLNRNHQIQSVIDLHANTPFTKVDE